VVGKKLGFDRFHDDVYGVRMDHFAAHEVREVERFFAVDVEPPGVWIYAAKVQVGEEAHGIRGKRDVKLDLFCFSMGIRTGKECDMRIPKRAVVILRTQAFLSACFNSSIIWRVAGVGVPCSNQANEPPSET